MITYYAHDRHTGELVSVLTLSGVPQVIPRARSGGVEFCVTRVAEGEDARREMEQALVDSLREPA